MTVTEGTSELPVAAPATPTTRKKQPGRATKKKRTAFQKYFRNNAGRADLTNERLANMFDVTERTIYRWKQQVQEA